MQTLKISKGLADIGHEVHLLCPRDSKIGLEAEKLELPVIPCYSSDIGSVKSIWKAVEEIKNLKPFVVHTHLSHDLWILVPAIKLTKSDTRLYLTKQMGSSVKKKDPLHHFLYSRVNNIFAISNYIRRSVLETCPVEESKITLMPNAISLDEFNPDLYNKSEVRLELGLDPDAMVIGMIGRFTPMKGHREFLKAAEIILKESDIPVKFLIVGGASYGEKAYESEMLNLSKELGLDNHIIFTGFREDVNRLMLAMDILAFPSHKESFGNILIEAMAMRLPVVASSSGGVVDIVVEGKTGSLVPPRNVEDLARAILRLIQNPDLRHQMSIAARHRVEEKYDFNRYLENLLQYYIN